MQDKHYPVLLKESIQLLDIKPEAIYVDCTLGRAGHSQAILERLDPDKGFLFCFDQDETAIEEGEERLSKNYSNFEIIHDNFANLKTHMAIRGQEHLQGILLDLGVSSPQFDVAERGFSYRFDGELDMRMDRSKQELTAKKVLNEFSEDKIAEILFKYGDEKFARSISRNICEQRKVKPIQTTFELVEIIKSSLPQSVLKKPKHPAKKAFQALRVYVNKELEVLESVLEQSMELLDQGGHLVVITFQSHEENIVKKVMKRFTHSEDEKMYKKLPFYEIKDKKFELLIKKPLKATDEELLENSRSHSAKLWALQKL